MDFNFEAILGKVTKKLWERTGSSIGPLLGPTLGESKTASVYKSIAKFAITYFYIGVKKKLAIK